MAKETYSMEELAKMLGMNHKELLDCLVDLGYLDINGIPTQLGINFGLVREKLDLKKYFPTPFLEN